MYAFAVRKKLSSQQNLHCLQSTIFADNFSNATMIVLYHIIIPCSFLFTIIIFLHCTMKSEQYLRLQMPCMGMSMDLYFASSTLVAFLSTIIIILLDIHTICAHVSVRCTQAIHAVVDNLLVFIGNIFITFNKTGKYHPDYGLHR